MVEKQEKDPAAFVDALAAMTDEEVFTALEGLEHKSEHQARTGQNTSETLALIGLTETEIGRRFPGQGLLPYKNWKKNVPI